MIIISISQLDSCIYYMKGGGAQTMGYGQALFFLHHHACLALLFTLQLPSLT